MAYPGNRWLAGLAVLALVVGLAVAASVARPAPAAATASGTSWSIVPSPSPQSTSRFSGVACVAAADCWGVGDASAGNGSGFVPLVEHWDGHTWTVVSTPTFPGGGQLSAVTCVASADCWTVGYFSDTTGASNTLTEHWNGQAWSVVASPNPIGLGELELSGVTCAGSSDCWTVGDFFDNSNNDRTLAEHWNGHAWSIVATPNPDVTIASLQSVSCPESTDCFSVGFAEDEFGSSQPLAEHWDGMTWSLVTLPAVGTGGLNSITCAATSNCWAVGNVGSSTPQPLAEHWDGTSWSVASLPAVQDGVANAVTCATSADCWTVGYQVNAGGTVSTLAESWNGQAWSVVPTPNPPFLGNVGPQLVAVACVSDSDCWALGTNEGEQGPPFPIPGDTLAEHLNAPYHPLVPYRITDTRTGSGEPNSGDTLQPGGTLNVQVSGTGSGSNSVPADATAVVLNVTATNPTAASFLTVYPTGTVQPNASNLNFVAGQTVPNLVEVPLGAGGQVSVFNHAGTTDVVVDVEGYVGRPVPSTSVAGLYNPVSPYRVTDTRAGSGEPNQGKTLQSGGTLDVQVTGTGQGDDSVPASGVAAVVLNVTATNPTSSGFFTVWPAGAPQPLASNVNFVPGQTVPNRVIVPVGAGGQISIFNHAGTTDLVVDVGGWFTDNSNPAATGAFYGALSPTRVCDTRPVQPGVAANQCNQNGAGSGTLTGGGSIAVQVAGDGGVPADATAVVLNVTATDTTGPSFFTIWPDSSPQPLASDLNWVPGTTVPNLVVVKVGAGGKIDVFNHAGQADVIVDVEGYYD